MGRTYSTLLYFSTMNSLLLLLHISLLTILTTSYKVTYHPPLSYKHPPYNPRLPWHVCPSFPHCALDKRTGLWYSDPALSVQTLSNNNNIKNIHTIAEEQQISQREQNELDKCSYEEEYCNTSEYIEKYQFEEDESLSDCRERCEENASCNYWTILTLRGSTTCYLLTECSAKEKCPNTDSCSSGPKKCTCPALVKTGGDESDDSYARWSCGEGLSYGEEIPVGTRCTATCDSWRYAQNGRVTVESYCLLGGDWSNTRYITSSISGYNGYSSVWAKPNEGDMQCGCDTITVIGYDPNEEPGAELECTTDKDFSGEWYLTTADVCVLTCNKDIAAKFECVDGSWTGEPQLGFWCYTDPGVEVLIINGGPRLLEQ